MTMNEVDKVRVLAIEVAHLCAQVSEEIRDRYPDMRPDLNPVAGTPLTAALRRRSMDLTRMLAKMRGRTR